MRSSSGGGWTWRGTMMSWIEWTGVGLEVMVLYVFRGCLVE